MSNNIDKSKLVYVNIVWMKYYRGLKNNDKINPESGGGSHPQEHLDAIEATMNLKSNNKVYNTAFVGRYTDSHGNTKWKKLNLKDHFEDTDGEKLDNATVVWVAQKNQNKKEPHYVVGWWENATLLRHYKRIKFYSNLNPISKDYNIFTDADNAYLIKEKFRDFEVPRQRDSGYGFGQSNIWYAEEKKAKKFKNKTINYINQLKGNNLLKITQP
ncbi:hypothetical protein C7957_102146 [Halanaerobium saccharolyticum]|jgi:hypothetical protein|uniref:Uncharacterized protein n=1 Tax=Halanaerobium saccharolyticum TaxID=43595 RepID=A0A4R6SJN7_9FIRM|nr:hypothetical protein [Halanaerobium saccharolyticum]TDQ04051.1 hypothetical protein C7957_102146 [Halanaerobium saccharolyticum]